MKTGKLILNRFALWEEGGILYVAGLARQLTTYIDISTGFFYNIIIHHGAQDGLPVKDRAPFLTSVCLSSKESKVGKEVFSGSFLTREEALEQVIFRCL